MEGKDPDNLQKMGDCRVHGESVVSRVLLI